MIQHPSSAELTALARGGLSGERTREVVRHLLLPCLPCGAILASAMQEAAAPVPEDEYDAALDRALQKALRYEQTVLRRKTEAQKLEKILAAKGELPGEADGLALCDALLARSWAVRQDDPAEMVRLAERAVKLAQSLDPRKLGPGEWHDLQSRAWAELGNALRVSDRHREATEAFLHARETFEPGTQDEGLDVRITELEASLAADRREFQDALHKLTVVFRYHRRKRNLHLAGRTLILKGLYTHYAGKSEEAILLLRQGRSLLDPNRDPDLHYSAAHNELLCLVNAGHIQEARKLRMERSRELSLIPGRVTDIRLRAIDARLDVAEGRLQQAETIFREVKQGFFDLGRTYHAGIAALDLAALLLRRGNWVEAKEEALEAIEVFRAYRIGPEAYASLIVLQQAFEIRMVTPAMVEEVAAHFRRAEHDPEAPFQPQTQRIG